MKRVIKYASLLFVSTAIMVSCGKKDDDVTPTTPEPTCDGGSVKTVTVAIDAPNTPDYTKSYSQNVTKCDGSAIIRLDIKSNKDMDKIYIVRSSDNGVPEPVFPANIKNSNGNAFTTGDLSKGYSLDLPDGLSGYKAFIVDIPVNVRSTDAAESDVYTIWITNGTGSFAATGKKAEIGPITVKLKYKTVASTFVTGTGIVLGDQNASSPSYLTTDGQVGTISGTALIESVPAMTADEKKVALNSADINFVGLAADGSTIGNGETPYFIGVGLRSTVGFIGNIEGTDMTKFGAYNGSKAFADLTATDIASLDAPTSDKIQVQNNTTYVFITQDGRKGVLRTSSLSTATTGKTVTVSIKVLTL